MAFKQVTLKPVPSGYNLNNCDVLDKDEYQQEEVCDLESDNETCEEETFEYGDETESDTCTVQSDTEPEVVKLFKKKKKEYEHELQDELSIENDFMDE